MEEGITSEKPLTKRGIAFSRLKRKALKHVWLVRFGLLAISLVGIYLLLVVFSSVIQKTKVGFYAGLVGDFIFTPEEKIESATFANFGLLVFLRPSNFKDFPIMDLSINSKKIILNWIANHYHT